MMKPAAVRLPAILAILVSLASLADVAAAQSESKTFVLKVFLADFEDVPHPAAEKHIRQLTLIERGKRNVSGMSEEILDADKPLEEPFSCRLPGERQSTPASAANRMPSPGAEVSPCLAC